MWPRDSPPARRGPKRPASAGAVLNLTKVAGVTSAPSWTMRARTPSRPSSSANPGPGHYDATRLDTTWCKRGPAYSLSGRLRGRRQATADHPGPGDYSPKKASDSPGCSFGGPRPRARAVADGPGPGQYDVRGSLGGTQRSSSTPSPARHRPQRSSSTSSLGRGRPLKSPREDGPGFYVVHGDGDWLTCPGSPGWVFGTGTRKSRSSPQGSGPSPGDYQVGCADLRSKPRYSFGARCEVRTEDSSAEHWLACTQFA